jgi:hypothetical protein
MLFSERGEELKREFRIVEEESFRKSGQIKVLKDIVTELLSEKEQANSLLLQFKQLEERLEQQELDQRELKEVEERRQKREAAEKKKQEEEEISFISHNNTHK